MCPGPDLAALMRMIEEGREAELTDLEPIARMEKKIKSALARFWVGSEP
jgi:hypothetical protein